MPALREVKPLLADFGFRVGEDHKATSGGFDFHAALPYADHIASLHGVKAAPFTGKFVGSIFAVGHVDQSQNLALPGYGYEWC